MMTTPEKLDQLINEKHQGKNVLIQTTEEHLTTALIDFAQGFQLDPELDAHLKAQFQVKPIKSHLKINPILRMLAVSVATFTLIAVTILMTPPLRAIAQEIIDTLFPRSENQTQVIEYVDFNREDIISYTSIENAIDDIEFDIQTPSILPDTIELGELYYYSPRNTLATIFRSIDGADIPRYTLYQQPLIDAQATGYFRYTEAEWGVGQDAESETIMIDDITGEFLRGSWVTTESGINAVYRWSDSFPIYRLRWLHNEIVYELKLVVTPAEFNMDEFIQFAESIMQG